MQQPSKLIKEGSPSVAKCHNNGRDVISKLSDDLIYQIIKHLTLRDAVKSSVLLHRWKSVCCYLEDLKFDWVNMFQDSGNSDFWGTCESPCVEYKDKLVRSVNQFLEFYDGAKVHNFEVSFCLCCDFSDDIDRWVSFAIKTGVEKLCLKLYCEKYCCKGRDDEFGGQSEGKHVFKTELFKGRESNNLKKLELVGCSLGQNFTNHFSCLNSLSLVHVPLFLYDMQSMFSCLINLKYLTLIKCSLPGTLCFGSLALLKCLYIGNCIGIKGIKLSNKKLKKFMCVVGRYVAFDFKEAPNLETLHHAARRRQLDYVFTCMSEHVPKLKVLTLGTKANWVTSIPESSSFFRNVEKLNLIFSCSTKFDLLKMVSILRAFPILERLTLETRCSEDMDRGQLEHSEYVHRHEHLKEVEIGGFYDTPNQIEFAIYFLKQAISLERLIISPSGRFLSVSRQSWDEAERENVYEQLHKFSKDAVLTI